MRTDKRYDRARQIVTDPLIPRLWDGSIALCHLCQRACFFAAGPPPNNRGYVRLLIRDLEHLAKCQLVFDAKNKVTKTRPLGAAFSRLNLREWRKSCKY